MEEREERASALAFSTVAITLYELARVLDPDSDETAETRAA
jgi:hypothetical protein